MSGGPPPDIPGDLEFLQHHWGEAYLIGAEDAGYTAVRRDGKGTKLVAADRDGLLGKIQADYTADPVSRDLPETAWRKQHPQGTQDEFVAAAGGGFHKDFAPVLRAVLFAADSRDVTITTGVSITEDPS